MSDDEKEEVPPPPLVVPNGPMLCSCWIPKQIAGKEYKSANAAAQAMLEMAPEWAKDPHIMYELLPRRLGTCGPVQKINELEIGKVAKEAAVAELITRLTRPKSKAGAKKKKVVEEEEDPEDNAEVVEMREELSAMEEQITEAKDALKEIQESFESEPISVTDWMDQLFQFFNAGHATFCLEASTADVYDKFTQKDASTALFSPQLKVLMAFQKQLKREKGEAAKLQVLVRMAPNVYDEAICGNEYLDGWFERTAELLGGEEPPESLDCVQIEWPALENTSLMVQFFQAFQARFVAKGKVKFLGVVNFDTESLRVLLDAGLDIASNEVPFSLLDRRTSQGPLLAFCQAHGIKLFCTNTTAAGLISSQYVGTEFPPSKLFEDPNLALQASMQQMETFGGWAKFQQLLKALKSIGDKHKVDVACVATRWVRDHPNCFPVKRLRWEGDLSPDAFVASVESLALDDADRKAISDVLAKAGSLRGDVTHSERGLLWDPRVGS
eukprot:jgi/Mesvir1/5188/Mv15321-RA.1